MALGGLHSHYSQQFISYFLYTRLHSLKKKRDCKQTIVNIT
jgi:hypothetical protein